MLLVASVAACPLVAKLFNVIIFPGPIILLIKRGLKLLVETPLILAVCSTEVVLTNDRVPLTAVSTKLGSGLLARAALSSSVVEYIIGSP